MNDTRLKSFNLKDIRIDDPFWNRYIALVKDTILPYQWDAMNDRIEGAAKSHCIENFRIAAGEAEGEFGGMVFQDTDVAKWLEAVGYTLAGELDEELEKTADEVIDLIGRAQGEDGYLNTYFTIKDPDQRWKNLREGHELYTAGHFIEAAVAYYEATGKEKLLDIVKRFADLICETFGPEEGKIHGYPGHQEVELALIRLYFVTNEKKYLDAAKYFIDARGQGENYFLKELKQPDYKAIFPELNEYDTSYSQSHLPVRQQETAEGHAVRAVYMYCAMADLAYEYKDQELFDACKKLWDNIVKKRMFITGSIGSSGFLERFTTDYDLPNDINYSETCATIGLALFGLRMGQITKDASYIDVVERALYNTLISGIAQDGKSFFYVNPLEVWPDNCLENTSRAHVKPIRQKWFGVACCPPNIARTLASLGQYIYSYEKDTIYVNLFVSNDTKAKLEHGEVKLSLSTTYPNEGNVRITLEGDNSEAKLAVRIPGFVKGMQITTETGEEVKYIEKNAYAYLDQVIGKTLIITFPIKPKFVRANPLVRADAGKVCIERGPIVYAFEEKDNEANLSAFYLDTSKEIKEYLDENLLGGTLVLEVEAKKIDDSKWDDELYGDYELQFVDKKLKAIPYGYWNNRGIGEMSVWMKELV